MLPELTLEPQEGDLDEFELSSLTDQLTTLGEENLGMAMTFTLVSHLREQLFSFATTRLERRQREEAEKERRALEEEEARTRGTPVTAESFKAWKAKFDKEMALKRQQDEEEKLRALSPKERDEVKKVAHRFTGRQLFERDRNLVAEDDAFIEEGTVSVDASQYDRTTVIENEDEEEQQRLEFSDSD